MVRWLALVVAIAAIAWSGWWFFGSRALEREYANWFQDRATEGWQAEYADLTMRGFPNRFDATWEGIALADPETGLAWTAPFFQLFMLSYKPGHVIAVWPEAHTFLTPEGRFEILNDSLQASLVTRATLDLPLERANLAADTMMIRDPQDGVTALAAFRAAIERNEDTDATYRIGATADGLALSAPLMQQLGGDLPDAFRTARLDMEVAFDKQWGLSALQDARPQPMAIKLDVAEAEWGPMQLRLAGDVTVDEFGTPEGEVSVQAREWRAMLDLAVATGAIPETFAPTIADVLAAMAGFSGNENALDLDLTLSRGQIFVGILPVGPAPKIRLR